MGYQTGYQARLRATSLHHAAAVIRHLVIRLRNGRARGAVIRFHAVVGGVRHGRVDGSDHALGLPEALGLEVGQVVSERVVLCVLHHLGGGGVPGVGLGGGLLGLKRLV